MSLAQAARAWHEAGVSTIPVLANGTKKPAIRWAPYIAETPTLAQVDHWWGNGQEFGLALICGKVSGNLEMTELEARACDAEKLEAVAQAMGGDPEARFVWDLLSNGYMEWTPSGGIHFLYRILDHPVPGNEKIAQDADHLCLAETRGEGGYVIVAPTSGLVHATQEPWTLISGEFGTVPNLTWRQRCLFHEVLRATLDLRPVSLAPIPDPRPVAPLPGSASSPRLSGATLTPGDDFELRTDWSDILEPHGWSLESTRGQERHWTRPGKSTREGASATTGRANDRDRLYVFSTSTIFDANACYTKFAAHALLNFGGDFHRAATDLARQGYGTRAVTPPELQEWIIDGVEYLDPGYRNNDDGNGRYLRDRIKDRYVYVREENQFYLWDGSAWRPDLGNTIEHEFKLLAREMADRAEARDDKRALKRWTDAGNMPRIRAAVNAAKTEAGVTVSVADFNPNRHKVNMANGILDLETGVLTPHDPDEKMTRTLGVSYDPEATAPRFEQFMEEVLPDAGTRAYVQRAVGYTLLGDADQRALFLIHGPSGTGKSQFIRIMEMVFGDYAATAPPGTFKASRDKAPSNDLHRLRGRRFVSTSETADNARFDEDLIKRITGRDQMSSRGLYQEFQEWTPECSLWLATNHPPRFNSDDDAIWRRSKLIPFKVQFINDGSEVPDIARRVLWDERDGIFNWILEGVRQYLQVGLGEPETIQQAAIAHRAQSDSVVRFLDDKVTEGILIFGPQHQMTVVDLYNMYSTWSTSVGEHRLGSTRFGHRLQSADRGLALVRPESGAAVWVGVTRVPRASLLGSFYTPG